jgi:hypothetical protein
MQLRVREMEVNLCNLCALCGYTSEPETMENSDAELIRHAHTLVFEKYNLNGGSWKWISMPEITKDKALYDFE